MYVQTELTKSNNNNNGLNRESQRNGTSEMFLQDLDLVSRFCVPICSRDNEVREMALDAISKTVEGWLDGVGSPKHYTATGLQNQNLRRIPGGGGTRMVPPPAEYVDLVALHLPIILRLSLSCPFANVRDKCQHILEIVESRGLPIPYPVISGPSAYIDSEEALE
ncbi:hypothetical protein WA026_016428 [Henosepilachna vigintioctopunctata]|uniref:Uncharacterized protein n=1 Tax=Henosepilachna vigintioctopunctata TaxID=420089 RepID=A0AAW1UNY3_9CUCU